MRSETSVGRVVGVLLLLQMATALILPFVLIGPLNAGFPAFLETAPASGVQIRAGVVSTFIGLGLTLALAVWLYPVLRPYSKRAALWFLAVCAVSAALDAVYNASVISMLSAAEKF